MKNKRYLIALDLDGTLLTDEKTISEKTLAYLKKLDHLGHVIVLASGRPLRSLKHYANQLDLHSPLITYNGSYVVSEHHNDYPTKVILFPEEEIKTIIAEIGLENLDNIMCETPEHIWLLREDEDLNSFFWHDGLEIYYGDIFSTLHEPAMTLIIKLKNRSKELQEKVKKAIQKFPNHQVRFWWDSDYAEMFYCDVTKAHALAEIADFYHIPHQNTIAFGDAENDAQMLTWAAHGIAMKNANPNCRVHARFISCLDNNHDGIIYELSKILKVPL